MVYEFVSLSLARSDIHSAANVEFFEDFLVGTLSHGSIYLKCIRDHALLLVDSLKLWYFVIKLVNVEASYIATVVTFVHIETRTLLLSARI
jgi:hypothetical protein